MSKVLTRRARYAAMYETGERGKNYFRFIYLEFPEGYISPATITLGVPHSGLHEFVKAEDQAELAAAFQTSQQNISKWLKNPVPALP